MSIRPFIDIVENKERETLGELAPSVAKHLTRTEWRNYDAAFNWLVDKGFKVVGRGAYGAVLSDRSRAVVKLFKNDPCYMDYVAFCRKHRGNPHVPRISKVYMLGGHTGVVFMELLTSLSEIERPEEFDHLSDYTFSLWANDKVKTDTRVYMEKHPMLKTLVDDLVAELDNGICKLDLHKANVMLRGSTMVIIDPVAP